MQMFKVWTMRLIVFGYHSSTIVFKPWPVFACFWQDQTTQIQAEFLKDLIVIMNNKSGSGTTNGQRSVTPQRIV